MTEHDAQQIADQFVAVNTGWSFFPIGIKSIGTSPDEWVVLYEATNLRGIKFDGPTVVLVNKIDRTAKFQSF